jgi:quercetin dioxygenase-like cupin family protein
MPTEEAGPVDEPATRLKRTETLRRTSSIPGRDIVEVRTEIPARVASGWHTHPGEEAGEPLATFTH